MFERILVVCAGNICRSPVAAAMLRRDLPQCRVSSAGLWARVGEGLEPTALGLAEREGLDLAGHRARQLTREMLNEASLILVMSQAQRRAVSELCPEALGKTMLLGHWLYGGTGQDIPDPYRKSREVFEHVHELLRRSTDEWANRVV